MPAGSSDQDYPLLKFSGKQTEFTPNLQRQQMSRRLVGVFVPAGSQVHFFLSLVRLMALHGFACSRSMEVGTTRSQRRQIHTFHSTRELLQALHTSGSSLTPTSPAKRFASACEQSTDVDPD